MLRHLVACYFCGISTSMHSSVRYHTLLLPFSWKCCIVASAVDKLLASQVSIINIVVAAAGCWAITLFSTYPLVSYV